MAKKQEVNRQFYYPFEEGGISIPDFTWKYLKLNAIESVLYGMMYSYHFINNTIEYYSLRIGISESGISRCLKRMVKEGLIAEKSVKCNGSKVRKVYTNCWGTRGRLTPEEIKFNLERGEVALRKYYSSVTPIRMRELDELNSKKR